MSKTRVIAVSHPGISGGSILFAKGIRTPVRFLIQRVMAGDEPDEVADDFGVPREDLELFLHLFEDILTPWVWLPRSGARFGSDLDKREASGEGNEPGAGAA